MISITNPKGYAYDKELCFRNAAKDSYLTALPNATTVYTETLEIPMHMNGRLAVEITFPASTVIPATYPFTVRALVGAATDPTTPASADGDQIIYQAVNKTIAAGTDVQWILPEQYSGYKYIRLAFTVATSNLAAYSVNAFMHALA